VQEGLQPLDRSPFAFYRVHARASGCMRVAWVYTILTQAVRDTNNLIPYMEAPDDFLESPIFVEGA
jgi:hypothetical protein